MPERAEGYDAPTVRDELGRTDFACRIYKVLVGTPPGWSVRVGLFGSWGSGKTSISEWILDWARRDGHVPVIFRAATEDKDSLLHSLGQVIGNSLSDAGLETSKTERAARVAQSAASNAFLKFASLAPAISLHGVSAGAALIKGLGEALRFDVEYIQKLQSALDEGTRIVIAIDDLDRADPDILPRILLALRDILDLPGFSFLLPFDDHAIRDVLDKKLTGAGAGEGS